MSNCRRIPAACVNPIRHLLPVLLLLLFMLPTHAALDRWGILSTGKGDAASLCDLATAELSKDTGVQLVERDALKQLTDEMLLSNALSPEGLASRLRLGEMLHADALVVLTLTGEGNSRILHVTVIHCLTGTRLRIEQFPWKTENLPALATHLCDLVITIRRQYAQGIRKIIGVPNFISRSFSRSYDPLQTSYSQLLQQVLMLEPGVAVIDTSEAQAIGRELAIGGQQRIDRVLPLMVQSEFRVETPQDKAPTISFTVSLTDKTGVIGKAESGVLPLDKAPEWITTALPAKIQAGQADAKPLSAEEQARVLADRADVFGKLGSLDQAIPLRESALLLNPDLPWVRAALVDEYYRFYNFLYNNRLGSSLAITDAAAKNEKAVELDHLLDNIITAYERACDHAEYIIKHRQLGLAHVTNLLDKLGLFTYNLECIGMLNEYPGYPRAARLPYLDAAEKTKQRFILSTIPIVMYYSGALPGTKKNDWDFWLYQANVKISNLTCTDIIHGQINADDLPFIRQAAELMPPDFIAMNIPDYYSAAGRNRYTDDFTEAQFLKFCEALAGSPHPLVRAYGQSGLLAKRFRDAGADKAKLLAVQADVNKLQQEVDAIPTPYTIGYKHLGWPQNINRDIAAALAKLNDPQLITVSTIKPNAVLFTPFQFKQSGSGAFFSMTKSHLIPCKGYDIVWREDGALCFHRHAEQLESIPLINDKTTFFDVLWDGQLIWVFSSRGVLVLDSGGKLLGTVPPAALPPFDHPAGMNPLEPAVRMYPAGPGRVLIVGVSDKDRRAWCASAEWTAAMPAPSFRIFLEATEIPAFTDEMNKRIFARNPKAAFNTFNIFQLNGLLPGDDPIVGISRALDQPGTRWYLDPLTVNLHTLQVGVWTPVIGLPALDKYQPEMQTADGFLLGFDNNDRPAIRLNVMTPGKTSSYRLVTVCNPAMGNSTQDAGNAAKYLHLRPGYQRYRSFLTTANGWIYLAGEEWWRIDPKTWTAQLLTMQPLEQKYFIATRYVISSLLGLIAWNEKGCYRVSIDESKIPQTGE